MNATAQKNRKVNHTPFIAKIKGSGEYSIFPTMPKIVAYPKMRMSASQNMIDIVYYIAQVSQNKGALST